MLYFYRFLFLLPLFLEHPVVIKRESSNNGSCSPVWHCSLDCCFFLNIVIFFMSVQCLRQLDMAGSRQSKQIAIPSWIATGGSLCRWSPLGHGLLLWCHCCYCCWPMYYFDSRTVQNYSIVSLLPSAGNFIFWIPWNLNMLFILLRVHRLLARFI